MSEIFEDADTVMTSSKGKGKAKAKRARRVVDSEDDSEDEADSDMDDFIVQSDEDEADKDAHQVNKKRFGKRRAFARVDTDSESDDEDRDVIHGQRMKSDPEDVNIKMLPRFLPSTKMKVSTVFPRPSHALISFASAHDGVADEVG